MIVDAGTVGMVWKPAPQQQTQQEESHAQDEKERD